jgi:hypothetical protein
MDARISNSEDLALPQGTLAQNRSCLWWRDEARSDRGTRDLKKAVGFVETDGMEREAWMRGKNTIFATNGRSEKRRGFVARLSVETDPLRRRVAAPEGWVARAGICSAADEKGAIRSGMAMRKWGAKTLEMGG